ncbi:MAG: oxalate decarboxylase [Methylobacteriaceae bacterium]|nr:oxalate decarboxylase [Methylobacteriaceae bacterium]
MISRRGMLAATAAGAAISATTARAASFGNPDEPPQGAINAKNLGSITDPGPQSRAIAGQFPSATSPPPTDVGSLPMDWASFNNAPRRIQDGGWARQVTQADFGISDTISGVNMRLSAGGIRELHWHQAAEWALMTYGKCRITVLDTSGRPYVADVNEGDLWYFPAGYPHSLQGLGPDGCEFIICFDDGDASEFNTLLVTDWFAHAPPAILAQNFGVPAETFGKIPLHDLWIFQGKVPGDLSADQAAASRTAGAPPLPFTFRLGSAVPAKETRGSKLWLADSSNFHVSTTVAAALVTLRPGALREMHWHPNADEWQYYIKGKARMGVFNTGPNVLTTDFNAGDIGYVKRNYGHYVQNVGDTDMQFLAVFRAPHYEEISLSDWLTHTPPALVAQHLNVDEATIARWPDSHPAIMPGSY